jgi:hypothetical protein
MFGDHHARTPVRVPAQVPNSRSWTSGFGRGSTNYRIDQFYVGMYPKQSTRAMSQRSSGKQANAQKHANTHANFIGHLPNRRFKRGSHHPYFLSPIILSFFSTSLYSFFSTSIYSNPFATPSAYKRTQYTFRLIRSFIH